MKRILFFLGLAVLSVLPCTLSAQPKVSVDERFELTGIVFRLTGEQIFAQTAPENYVADIDSCFSKYKEHELIQFLRKMLDARKSHWEFNVITDLAADIEIASKGIVWTKQWETLYESEAYSQQDDAFSKAELKEYLRLLNKFYKDTKFHKFYTEHRQFYDSAEARLQVWVDQIDTAWFRQFFGQPFEMANIWVVPSNGRHNFALDRKDKNGKSYHNCAIGCSATDASGFPQLSYRSFMTLIHEICHNYNNPACDLHKDLFNGICDTLYSYVGKDLEKNYYGGQNNILYEGLNRLCEYTYYKEHNTLSLEEWERRVCWEEEKGFLWLHELIDYAQAYQLNRDKYRTYAEFVPEIVGFLRQVAADMEDYYLPKRALFDARVVSSFPANGSVVDTDISKVVFMFSRPMQDARGLRDVENENVLSLPMKDDLYGVAYWEWMKDTTQPEPDYDAFEHPAYWENEYTFVILLAEPLKSKSKYGVRLRNMPDKLLWHPVNYELIFETR